MPRPATSLPTSELLALQFILRAIDLKEQPRRKVTGFYSFAAENTLAEALQQIAEITAAHLEECSAPTLSLLSRWQSFQRSSVMQQRNLELGAANTRRIVADVNAAMIARAATDDGTRRCCALGSCSARELHPAHFKKCAACQTAVYCCKEHQATDWPARKPACKAARKAAEKGGAGGS
jgi:hypothetical protein